MTEESLKYLTDMDLYTLEELMDEYGQDVWNYAYFLTKNRAMADDIAQDVFIQAFRHVAAFRKESSIKTWLLRITRNISYNYRNTAFIRKVLLVDVVSPTAYSHSAEQVYLENEAANRVWQQVWKLPIKSREVLLLHAKYQLSLAEIALLLLIPEGTVKSRLFHARKRMSILLQEEWIHEPAES